jgi:HK97 family phage prohead protease
MNDIITREATGYIQKAATVDRDGVFVLNEESKDRMGDIIKVDGWKLTSFKKNPIALMFHDHTKPVGRWPKVWTESKQLMGELKLGSTRLAEMARQLISDGILKAVSVGFRVLEYEPVDKDDEWGPWIIKSAELYEVSLVSVPAHPNALMLSKSLGLTPEERRLVFRSSKHQNANPELEVHPAIVKARQAIAASRALRNKR